MNMEQTELRKYNLIKPYNKLKSLKINYQILRGELSVEERQIAIDEFKKRQSHLIINAETGGGKTLGINTI